MLVARRSQILELLVTFVPGCSAGPNGDALIGLQYFRQCDYNVIIMKAKIIKIGNSKGVRLPKSIIQEVGLGDEVMLEASKGTIVIRPISAARANWGSEFEAMARKGDDKLLLPDSQTSWEREDWQWK